MLQPILFLQRSQTVESKKPNHAIHHYTQIQDHWTAGAWCNYIHLLITKAFSGKCSSYLILTSKSTFKVAWLPSTIMYSCYHTYLQVRCTEYGYNMWFPYLVYLLYMSANGYYKHTYNTLWCGTSPQIPTVYQMSKFLKILSLMIHVDKKVCVAWQHFYKIDFRDETNDTI